MSRFEEVAASRRALAVSTLVALVGCTTTVEVEGPAGDGGFAPPVPLVLSGRVSDARTQRPIAAASVRLLPPPGETTTNADGAWSLSTMVERGQPYRVLVAREGYATQTVEITGSEGAITADVALEPIDAELSVGVTEIELGALATRAEVPITDLGDRSTVLAWRAQSDAAWLELGADMGEVTDVRSVLTLTAHRDRLGEQWGEHSATVQITSNGGAATVTVRLRHLNPADHQLVVTSTAVFFGDLEVDRTLRLENVGSTPLQWEIRDLPSFVEVPTRAGQIAPRDFVLVNVHADRRPLSVGRRTEPLTVASDAEVGPREASLAVTIDVSADPILALEQTELDFGDTDERRSLVVYNRGKGELAYTITSELVGGRPSRCQGSRPGDGVRVDAMPDPGGTLRWSGRIPGDGQAVIPVTVGRSLLRPRIYVAPLRVVGGGRERVAYAAFRVPERRVISVAGGSGIGGFGFRFLAGSRICVSTEPIPWSDDCAEWANAVTEWRTTTAVPWLSPQTPVASNASVLAFQGDWIQDEPFDAGPTCFDLDLAALADQPGEYTAPVRVVTADDDESFDVTVVVPAARTAPIGEFPAEITARIADLQLVHDPYRDVAIAHAVDAAGHHTWEHDGGRLTHTLTSTGPAYEPNGLVFDLWRGRAYGFAPSVGGSFMDVWEWSNGAWLRLRPPSAPPARDEAAFAFDSRRGVVVMSGGGRGAEAVRDAWTFDGTVWAPLSPSLVPASRIGARMVYEPNTDRLVVVGGRVYDPPAREGHGMVALPRGDGGFRYLMFGGLSARGVLAETWTQPAAFWQEETLAVAPPARWRHAMAAAPGSSRVWLFGGCALAEGCDDGRGVLGDTWIHEAGGWRPFSGPSPEPRSGARLSWDPDRAAFVLFGGRGAGGWLTDTWLLDDAGWRPLNTTAAPPGRSRYGMAYDEARRVMVVHGGVDASGTLGDVWELSGTGWMRPNASGGPDPMADHTLHFLVDNRAGDRPRVMSVGSSGASWALWEWDGSSWRQQTVTRPFPPFAPEPRRGHVGLSVGAGAVYIQGGRHAWDDRRLSDAWTMTGCQGSSTNRCSFRGGAASGNAHVDETWIVEAATRTATRTSTPQFTQLNLSFRLLHDPRLGRTLRSSYANFASLVDGDFVSEPLIDTPIDPALDDVVTYDWANERFLYMGFAAAAPTLRMFALPLDRSPRDAAVLDVSTSLLDLGFDDRIAFEVYNLGGRTAPVRLIGDAPWIRPAEPWIDLAGYGRRALELRVERRGLGSGPHEGRLRLIGPAGTTGELVIRMEVQ